MYKGLVKSRTLHYVMERKCESGGFCFYRLEVPNCSDTYYALSILNFLSADFKDDSIVAYLKNVQKKDGSYSNIYLAHYSIKGLLLLREKPKYNPKAYIQKNIQKIRIYNNDIIKFIFNFKNDDHGFGHQNCTLIETAYALSMLNWLNYPIDLLEAERFVKERENPVFGFANIPNTEPSFIEHIHAGVIASTLLAYKPNYLNQCIKFIRGCQNSNGGFARSSLGISTWLCGQLQCSCLALSDVFI